MRNKLAKVIKKDIAIKMYVGDDVTESDIRKDRKSVYASSDFKSIYRARKKKVNNPHHSTNEVFYPTKPGVNFPGKQKKQ